ncbi:MAG: non-heme iron oxygenase ferredoxin subunit [Anaerolineaceae bacterium]|nr:non-heme iron oxygenase ferredoxin subunit [Anaerolineaceae bacterium]
MSEQQKPYSSDYEYYQIAEIHEIPPGERLFLEIDDIALIVFNINGEYFALDDMCTHDYGSLGEAEIEDYRVTCPRHGAKFDIRTGEALSLPAVKRLSTYPIRIVDGIIEIGVKPD